jgi:hypothetical protein
MSQAGELSLRELEDEITAFASHLYAGMSQWLELVGELDRGGDWTDCGAGSCAEWLAWRCALLPRAAREHVRVARKLPELPLIRAAFARGELSYSKVRALTRVADADREEELLELARALTAAQLDRAVRAFQRVITPDANNLHDRAYVSTFWDDDGCPVVRARLAPEDGGLFLRALEAAYDSLWERAGDDRPQWEKRSRWESTVPRNRARHARRRWSKSRIGRCRPRKSDPAVTAINSSYTSMPMRLPPTRTAQARASRRARRARRSRPRRPQGLRATAPLSRSAVEGAARWTLAARRARFHPRCVGRCAYATVAAASRAVRTGVS